MLDFIIVLGSGALSLGIMEKLTRKNAKDLFKRICRWMELSFINFAGTYFILRIFHKALIVETTYCNYISVGLASMAVYVVVSIVTGFFFAFMVSRVQLLATCVKNEEEKVDAK